MATVAVEEAVTTRLEITGGAVSPWSLLVVLAQATGLDEAALAHEDHHVGDLTLSGMSSWAQVPVALTVSARADGRVTAVLTAGPATRAEGRGDEADRDAVADAALAAAGDWLDVPGVRWRWRTVGCVDDAWHCGWRLAVGGGRRHPVPAPPVAAWRRWTALGVDWAGLLVGYGLLALVLLLHLLQTASPTPVALAVAATVALIRQVTAGVAWVVDPSDSAPRRWWIRLVVAVENRGLTVLLAAAVIVLGGGWLA